MKRKIILQYPRLHFIFSSPISKGMSRLALSILYSGIYTVQVQTSNNWQANLLLLITAMIWGFSFVAQRQGMEHVSPFTFNAVRFGIGAASLLPIIVLNRRKQTNSLPSLLSLPGLTGGLCLGLALFFGSSFQQIGIVDTTAGKAGFITGLYVILVPILGLFWKQKTGRGTWIGAILAVIGMYFLSVNNDFVISKGDTLVLISALFWAIHVQLISWFSQKFDPLLLSLYQFSFCSVFSWLAALKWDIITLSGIQGALFPLLYTGIFSVGIAYTLQIVAQKRTHPGHAAIILSLESVFAVIGGYVFLAEIIPIRGLFGCGLMLAGMVLSQLLSRKKE